MKAANELSFRPAPIIPTAPDAVQTVITDGRFVVQVHVPRRNGRGRLHRTAALVQVLKFVGQRLDSQFKWNFSERICERPGWGWSCPKNGWSRSLSPRPSARRYEMITSCRSFQKTRSLLAEAALEAGNSTYHSRRLRRTQHHSDLTVAGRAKHLTKSKMSPFRLPGQDEAAKKPPKTVEIHGLSRSAVCR